MPGVLLGQCVSQIASRRQLNWIFKNLSDRLAGSDTEVLARRGRIEMVVAPYAQDSRVAYNPPMDAVGEVKIESFMADAAYGHTGVGTVNIVLKGGTNQLHGSLYEF